MAKKKRLTKRERQLRQFKREQAARETKKELMIDIICRFI